MERLTSQLYCAISRFFKVMPSKTKSRRSFEKHPKVARCEQCKAILSREQKHSCTKCSLQTVVNVEVGAENVANVEAEVAACHSNGRSRTEINVHNTSVGFTTAASLPDPRPGLTYIPVHECQLDAYKSNPEDKALVGVLLKARQYTESASNERKIQFNGQSSYQQCSKARKRQHYDHILIFVDILPQTSVLPLFVTHIKTASG